MRVIAGQAKGRKLQTIEGTDTRPTTDRIKENLFNVIAFDLPQCQFLDLFSGSGAIGIEALSRGARQCIFVEQSTACQQMIRENLNHTQLADKAEIFPMETEKALEVLAAQERVFDIIFLDPPYASGLAEPTLSGIISKGLLNQEGYVIVEHAAQVPLSPIPGLRVLREKQYRTTVMTFLCLEEEVL